MAKKMLIDATHAEECRVVVVDGNKVDEFDFESVNKRQLAGNIYLAKVTRVEPSLQAAFVDYGGNRHGFLAFSEIHPDYYQIPVADREALLAEERAYNESLKDDEDKPRSKSSRSRSRRRSSSKKDTTPPEAQAAKSETDAKDAVETREVTDSIPGMDVVDTGTEAETGDLIVDTGAVETATETETQEAAPVETPATEVAEAPAETTVEEAAAEPVAEEAEAKEAETEEAPAADTAEEASEDSASEDASDDDASDDDGDDSDDDNGDDDASEKDSDIESVADEDVSEEIRLPRKPRPKRYKIQEVIKVRQIMLVQVVKEERGNKGAALTTYLSLAGRYCVLMPNTARGGGISRKITNAPDRKKLKEIAGELSVPEGAGLIIRTAGAKRTKSEIKRDYEYLQRLWEQIRELTLKSVAPAPIYEEGNLIKRSIRDLYNREIDEVLVEGEAGYRVAKDFMKMIMPSHAKNVKHYQDALPLFARYQVESYLSSMFNPTVQLKSGGYIVIGVTEALVAIDVNSGRATKEGSIEETALKTNLEAAEEVARQLRLRDLAGLIVIDFIDMEERRNNTAVEKRLKDKLKTDRARIQVGRISGFGLLEMSRQRLRPGMIEATTQPCPSCHGTGLIRSDDNLALSILRQLEEEAVRGRSKELLLKAPIGIVNFLMNQKREHIAQIEARYGISIRVEADPHLVSPDFTIEKFKTATRAVPEVTAPVISIDTSDMPELEEEEEAAAPASTPEEGDAEDKPKKKRRRRRRRKSSNANQDADASTDGESNGETGDEAKTDAETSTDAAPEGDAPASEAEGEAAEEAPKPKKRTRTRRKKTETPAAETTEAEATADTETKPEGEVTAEAPAETEEKPKRTRTRRTTSTRKKKTEEVAEEPAAVEAVAEEPASTPEPEVETAAEPAPEPVAELVGAEAEVQTPVEPEVEVAEIQPEPEPVAEPEPEQEPKPKKRGWWSLK
ncbi:Rne/Rng family ribonuclease [Rhodovulum sp. FJ3]|uniref:Rne/Rng family ribonuclease n=1 Tax=Rhodovulum sp. FJ3 TaxID=3079053 RepID=UPI00293DEF01|nr:Rne/Rng family ribonuclease [Rhodovulum sp. FJ3]MDV4168017.1 Rne/Rng family ribonuclease [Rhodovulum sp. FJ3]